MEPREPAGGERGEGESAEPPGRARPEGGSVGNTCGTVRGLAPRGRYPLTESSCLRGMTVGRGASLPAFSFAPAKAPSRRTDFEVQKTKSMEDAGL